MKNQYNVIAVGSAGGTEGAAMIAIKEGAHVIVIDHLPDVVSNCTHSGTIPSKTLRQRGDQYQELLKSAESIKLQQVNFLQGFYD